MTTGRESLFLSEVKKGEGGCTRTEAKADSYPCCWAEVAAVLNAVTERKNESHKWRWELKLTGGILIDPAGLDTREDASEKNDG